jgi:hypothetical protein
MRIFVKGCLSALLLASLLATVCAVAGNCTFTRVPNTWIDADAGADISISTAGSVSVCEQRCCSEPRCEEYTFYLPLPTCYLRSALSPYTAGGDEGAYSGYIRSRLLTPVPPTPVPPTPVPAPPLLDGFLAFLSYVQLPFVGAILFLSTLTIGILRALPQAWSRHRLVEVALKVVAPILLTLGAWVPLAHVKRTDFPVNARSYILSPGMPGKQEPPCGGATAVAAPSLLHPRCTGGGGPREVGGCRLRAGRGCALDEVARRTPLVFVSAPQVLLNTSAGGVGVDEGQARANRFADVIAPCPRRHPQPDVVLLESRTCIRSPTAPPPRVPTAGSPPSRAATSPQ